MTKIIYKTLFKVIFLHEYYLTDSNSESIFRFDSQNDRINFLAKRFEKSQETISNDISFEIPNYLKQQFKNYNLHLTLSNSGFEVFTTVKENFLADGSKVYKMITKLPDDFDLAILLRKKDNAIDTISNRPFKEAIPCLNYFTNQHLSSDKTFPNLTNAIPPFDATRIYEQGTLASFGPNDVRQFSFDGTEEHWSQIIGTEYANEGDQLLVPWEFDYCFSITEKVTNAKFILNDETGSLVRSYEFISVNYLSKVRINFKNFENAIRPVIPIIGLKIYSLNVTVNDAQTVLNKVIFLEDSLSTDHWGLLNIKPKVDQEEFNLEALDGFIKYRKSAIGTITEAPVFEVHLKSRLTFWKYINDKKQKLKTSIDTSDFLKSSENNLVSISPRTSTLLPTLFRNESDNTLHYIPNPGSYERISRDGRQIFTDIIIQESTMFPIESS